MKRTTLAAAIFLVACSPVTSPDNEVLSLKPAASVFEAPAAGVSPFRLQTIPADPAESFLGIYVNEVVTLPLGSATSYTVSFDLYILGSWDGAGKQAQHGTFAGGPDGDEWEIAYTCGDGRHYELFRTTFSNQKTVQQNFPRSVRQKGERPAMTGAYAIGTLGFHQPDVHVTSFTAEADVTYRLSYQFQNQCGGPATLLFRSPEGRLQQNGSSFYDESWGLDNLVVTAG